MSNMDNQDLQERNTQILTNISQLQNQEQELYGQLNDVNLTQEQKQIIINKIQELSQIRLNLYANIKDLLYGYQQNASAGQDTLKQQINAVNIVEEQLNKNKIMLNALQAQKQNKLRLVEINTYYGQRYSYYKNLMKTIVYFCIPIAILSFIYGKGLLPEKLFFFLIGIIIIIAIFIIGYQIIDISNRDNMNWDEYDWYFNKSNAPTTSASSGSQKNPWELPSITCVGQDCCYPGSQYDASQNMCIPMKKDNGKMTETMISGILGKYGFVQINPVANVNQNVKPSNSLGPNYAEI